MGNARSSSRRSVHSFCMQEENSRSYEEPLLNTHEQRDAALVERSPSPQRRRVNNKREDVFEHKALQAVGAVSPSATAAAAPMDLKAVIHQLNSFYAVLWPVCITMVITSVAACYATDDQLSEAMTSYMYYKDIDASSKSIGEKTMLALCNALFVVAFIACLTFAIVFLYKFNCMRLFLGYCIVYSGSLLAMAGTKMVVVVCGNKLHWVFDSVSLGIVMYNFAIVGVLSIFYQKGIPTIVEQAYLVAISVIVAWQLSQLPEWSIWMILLLLGFWDLFAVLTPIGPLKWLIDLVHEKGTPLPGLLFQADIKDSHRATRPTEQEFLDLLLIVRPLMQPTAPPGWRTGTINNAMSSLVDQLVVFLCDHKSVFQGRARELSHVYANRQCELWQRLYAYYDVQLVPLGKPYPPVEQVGLYPPGATASNSVHDDDEEEEDAKSIKLGLGDFIFYSVLVARAAKHGFASFVACFLCVIAGLAVTMYLLAHYDALPALPISIFSGIVAFALSVELLEPFLNELTSFGTITI